MLLGAGYPYHRHIAPLREAGYRVVAVDRDPAAPGLGLADAAVVASIRDAGAVVAAAREHRADAIVATTESGVIASAAASAQLGLPGPAPAVALAMTNKGRMRALWKAAGLRQPEFVVADSRGAARDALRRFGLPAVVKPVASWGSNGVSVVAAADDIEPSLGAAFAVHGGPAIVERFVAGPLLTAEGFVAEGEARVVVIGDVETQSMDRHRVNTAIAYPGAFNPAVLAEARSLIEAAALALGLARSPFHAECLVGADGVYLVEMAARGGGGHIFSTLYQPMLGTSGIVHQARLILGETGAAAPPMTIRGGCYLFLSAPRGRLVAVEGLEAASALPGVIDAGVALRIGERGGPVGNDQARHGHVVTVGRDRDEAVARARAVRETIRFVMAD